MKYAEIRASSDPLFPVYGQNRIRIFPYLRYDSVHIRENTDQESPHFGIFYEVREQKLDAT